MLRKLTVPGVLLTLATAAAGDDLASTGLDTITIFGERAELTRTVGSAHSIDQETLRTFSHDDINRVLKWVPGLYIRGEDGYGLRPNIGLRGANSDRSQKVTLLEDGVLFGPAPYAAPAAYYFPLTARMTGVEVFKGPAAIAHGPQTIGGAINLVSAPVPSERESELSVAGGSDAYRRLQGRVGGPLGPLRGQAEVVHIGSDGFKQLDGGGDTGFDKTEAQLKLRRDFADGGLELRLGYATEISDETYLGLTEADFRAQPERRYRASARDRFDWDWGGVRLDYVAAAGPGRLKLTAYHHLFERAWTKFNNLRGSDIREVLARPDAPGNRLSLQQLSGEIDTDPEFEGDDMLIGTNDREFRSSGLQGLWSWSFGETWSHGLQLGARLHSDRIDRLHDEFSFEMLGGELVRNDVPRAITADNTGRATALALWLRDEIEYGRWTIAPGLRVEAVRTEFVDRRAGAANDESYSIVLPGVGVNFAQTPALSWLAGVHRGFSPASPGLGRDVEPEDAVNLEAGLRWNGGVGHIEAIGFFSDYRNLTAQCTFSTGCDDAAIGEQTNAGEVRVLGLETTWSSEFSPGRGWSVPVELGYTYTDGEFRERFDSTNPQFGSVEPGFELPYVPEHRANLRLGLAAGRWSAQLSASYVSAMRDQAGRGPIPSGQGSDSHTVVDWAASWAVSRSWRVTARIDNLLDRDYVVARRPFGARPGKPLTGQLGVEWRYAAAP